MNTSDVNERVDRAEKRQSRFQYWILGIFSVVVLAIITFVGNDTRREGQQNIIIAQQQKTVEYALKLVEANQKRNDEQDKRLNEQDKINNALIDFGQDLHPNAETIKNRISNYLESF
jgi:hypothetical protein